MDVSSNRKMGWASLALGAASGLVLGLWSFQGPLPVPELLGDYDDVARRLARLGHIAFFGLGILNLLLAGELSRSRLTDSGRRIAGTAMNLGNLLMPPILFCAAAWHPAKYLLPVPATAVFVALILAAWGARR
jgi:hypothetical protein